MFAIEFQNVSKMYKIYTQPVDRLKEILFRRPLHQAFYSLQAVSFNLPHGGVMGVLGDNGAGKSTLLKILAGTLSPSTGQAVCRGRVAALLELGAGFHPEFTGRQNIYLNAALLGLSDAEIRQREAEIIDFSELNEFIERPVKTYSSGMYVRLAFAIATSVDPDILIIDEALSVGDGHFQQKCVNRIMRFKQAGKTILFCSHSLYLAQTLCDTAIWLHHGQVRAQGEISEVIAAYSSYLEALNATPQAATQAKVLPQVSIEQIVVQDAALEPVTKLAQFDDLFVTVQTRSHVTHTVSGHLGVAILKDNEQVVFLATTKQSGLAAQTLDGEAEFRLQIPALALCPGTYKLKALVGDDTALHLFDEQIGPTFKISGEYNPGVVWLSHAWITTHEKG